MNFDSGGIGNAMDERVIGIGSKNNFSREES